MLGFTYLWTIHRIAIWQKTGQSKQSLWQTVCICCDADERKTQGTQKGW